MNTNVKYQLAIASVFLWIGFVCAISFMEAWLKFQAPGVTLSIGLGIGKIIFRVLNKLEWVFVVGIVTSLIISKSSILAPRNIFFFITVFLLVVQTLWLLPTLDYRADQIIQGIEVPASNLHFYYVGIEALKIICLFIFGIKLLSNQGKI
jgi:hypothetical protein